MDRLFILLLMIVFGIVALNGHNNKRTERIDGFSLVAPRDSAGFESFPDILETGAEWVAVIPFAFAVKNEPGITFNHEKQWWGERSHGIRETIKEAHKQQLKVMIKPHVWVRGDGWPGEFDLDSEEKWRQWESAYRAYILEFAGIAEETNAGMFCVGTEFRYAVRKRPDFWKDLIGEVRKIYSGKLTYAANWDNYEQVTFWPELDYIGIDAYFPLSEEAVPDVKTLVKSWKNIKYSLENLSSANNRPILFTEFGYRSTAYAAAGHWNYNLDSLKPDLQGQVNCYEALLSSFWNEEWMAGGFVWKYHMVAPSREEFFLKEYSPQNKPALEVIRNYYSRP